MTYIYQYFTFVNNAEDKLISEDVLQCNKSYNIDCVICGLKKHIKDGLWDYVLCEDDTGIMMFRMEYSEFVKRNKTKEK